MSFSKQIVYSLLITHLLPHSSANPIYKEPELGSVVGPGLSDRSTPKIPQLGRRDEDFSDWLKSHSGLSSRDVETNSARDVAPDVEPRRDSPSIFPRGDHLPPTTVDQVVKQMNSLVAADHTCSKRAAAAPRLASRSLEIEKRVDHGPSNCLWNTALAMVVDQGASIYHDWASPPPAIGTRGLCGCTAVAIISQVGTIVAHISPDVGTIDVQLNEMLRLYNDFIRPQAQAYAYYFPPTDTNHHIQVPNFQDYINHFLQTSMQLAANVRPYVADPSDPDGHVGTVVVKKVAGSIALYLNDLLVN